MAARPVPDPLQQHFLVDRRLVEQGLQHILFGRELDRERRAGAPRRVMAAVTTIRSRSGGFLFPDGTDHRTLEVSGIPTDWGPKVGSC